MHRLNLFAPNKNAAATDVSVYQTALNTLAQLDAASFYTTLGTLVSSSAISIYQATQNSNQTEKTVSIIQTSVMLAVGLGMLLNRFLVGKAPAQIVNLGIENQLVALKFNVGDAANPTPAIERGEGPQLVIDQKPVHKSSSNASLYSRDYPTTEEEYDSEDSSPRFTRP